LESHGNLLESVLGLGNLEMCFGLGDFDPNGIRESQ
jgi:hypothetical protein